MDDGAMPVEVEVDGLLAKVVSEPGLQKDAGATRSVHTIAAGDDVIVYEGPETLSSLVVKVGDVFQCRFGRFPHEMLVGIPFGSRVRSAEGGFVHVLYPTPELWTLVLPHRTQILYHADIAFIVAQLDLVPGSVVIEAGTGSGSFTHSLARTVAPHGRVYTCEYHETRAAAARAEFGLHGLDGLVVLEHRDVCANGFEQVGVADAGEWPLGHTVFLDLPAPWDVIAAAKKALNVSDAQPTIATRICTFSPSIEQVQRSCDALRRHGFSEVRTFETLARPMEVRQASALLTALPAMPDGSAGASSKRGRDAEQAGAASWARPQHEMRGHTSYLTFATLLPAA